ncbi:hypothetical protein [Rhizobium lentis]|uniref:ABC-type glycerol-3-phosphate transport system permease component n=1 Tax=Rhizobium lentis TaxID=1138194 RepID=A0A7W8XEZ5_9HYPH|nr:hypothetical protein [Rhizobium lentis]MBB4574739.1 ABC-type glycerol-3-phosphate transport system permease component [Rhizobium lentis]MBB5550666.1 ABC-type glycerol-3-phosphate transport system permease component [Rhizobium lentis]MBB5561212.1 ABC-type glycerol-3-phosphate transport system permease component [Rhizobium lentis]MBB5567785.1 ABC-type glycerol-3-phosphate transport system permease component [Rhizobium lentis]
MTATSLFARGAAPALRILVHIVVPIIVPGIVSTLIIVSILTYNEFRFVWLDRAARSISHLVYVVEIWRPEERFTLR